MLGESVNRSPGAMVTLEIDVCYTESVTSAVQQFLLIILVLFLDLDITTASKRKQQDVIVSTNGEGRVLWYSIIPFTPPFHFLERKGGWSNF